MEKNTLICFVVLFLSQLGSSNSEATIEESGDITQDPVWTADDVHLVTANIAVVNGARSLTPWARKQHPIL
ncbi:MAG: hypothetical protein JRD93_07380 [Deltaproteobacteria bacterium]|nr:hypothetical protein [Deltaproteobacteria bacterium]